MARRGGRRRKWRGGKLMTLEQALEKYTIPVPFCGCLIWLGSVTNGYAQWKQKHVHRLVYERAHGELPPGMMACHTCDIRFCVEENHLYAGTHKDNMRDYRNRGARKWETNLQTPPEGFFPQSDYRGGRIELPTSTAKNR